MTVFNWCLLILAAALCAFLLFRDYTVSSMRKRFEAQKIEEEKKSKGKRGKNKNNSSGNGGGDAAVSLALLPDINRELALSNTTFMIILIIGIIAAVLIRVWAFGDIPGGFNQDGAMAAVDAKALADYGTDRYGMHMPAHLTAWGYGQMSALLSYMMVPFIKLMGLTPISARLPQLIVSLAGIAVLYLFVRDLMGKVPALIVALFAAICPWHIIQSRWALDCNLFPHFFVFGLYFLYRGVKYKKYNIYIAMFFFAMCMYCYGISIYTIPVFLAAAAVWLIVTKRISIKELLISIGVYLLFAWPFILTMIVNFLKLDTIELPFVTIPYFEGSVRSNDLLFFSEHPLEQLKTNFTALMNVTLLQKKDLPWNDIEGFGTIYKFSMPFFFMGLIYLFKNIKKNAGLVLVLMALCMGIWSGLITASVNINRINIIYYSIIIITGIGIYHTVGKLKFLSIPAAGCYALAFVLFISAYFGTYAEQIQYSFMKNFGDAVESLKDSDAEKLYITADSQYEGASNVSEILTLFYHQTDAEYYQGKKTVTQNGVTLKPFNERYSFVSMKNITVDPKEDAQYVITQNDLQYFDADKFDFEQFGDYYTATPKSAKK